MTLTESRTRLSKIKVVQPVAQPYGTEYAWDFPVPTTFLESVFQGRYSLIQPLQSARRLDSAGRLEL